MPEEQTRSHPAPAQKIAFNPAEYGAVEVEPSGVYGATTGPVSVPPVNPGTGTYAMGPTIDAAQYAAKLVDLMGPDIGMIAATAAVPALAPAAVLRYGPMAARLYTMGVRAIAAGVGRAGGTVAGQQAAHYTGAPWAPASSHEAFTEQLRSAGEGVVQQATLGEALPGIVEGAVKKTLASEGVRAAAERSSRVGHYRDVKAQEAKIAGLEVQRADEMARISAEQAKQRAIVESNESAGKIVSEIGPKYGPNQLEDLSGRLNQQIRTALGAERKAKYGVLDDIALANETAGEGVVTDGSKVVDKIIEIEKRQPRGAGVWSLWTAPEAGVGPLNKMAKNTVKKVEASQQAMIDASELMGVGNDIVGAFEDVATALRAIKDAQKGYGEVPLGVALKARGTVARALANPETSNELKGILRQVLPDIDTMNRVGLAKVDPELIGLYEEAKHFWHQSSLIEDRVLYGLFKTGRSVKPLTDYIEANSPRAVERVRDVLRRTGDEAFWPAVQRTKFSELLVDNKGQMDLAGLAQRLDDLGSTLPRLARDSKGAVDPLMNARIDGLRQLSKTYSDLMKKDPLVVSERLNRLDAVLAKEASNLGDLKRAGVPQGALSTALQYARSPRVIAGIALGSVFGWEAALVGGGGGAALKSATDAGALGLVKLAENPQRMASFLKTLEAYTSSGEPTKLLNLKRMWDASQKSKATWQEAIASLSSSPEPSHERTIEDTNQ